MDDGLLVVDGLSVGYRGGIVIKDASFSLPIGGSVAILGRNGAGKSTLIQCLAGHLSPSKGRISFDGSDISQWSPQRRCRAGIALVPQGREIFAPLTVDENLQIAAVKGAWGTERVYSLFPQLASKRRNFGDQLSGGEQQMLAIGRALVTNPRLILLDEPLEGLAPSIAQRVADCITQAVREEGIAFVLAEQNVSFSLRVTEFAIALENGIATPYRADS